MVIAKGEVRESNGVGRRRIAMQESGYEVGDKWRDSNGGSELKERGRGKRWFRRRE